MKSFSPETRLRMSESAKRRCQTDQFQNQVQGYWQPFCSREDLERDYLTLNMSQMEIASRYSVTLKRVQTSMRRFGIQTRRRIPRNQRGAANSTWKGNQAGYDAMHVRLIVAYGKPQYCMGCQRDDNSIRYEWANLTGNYQDMTDYARMCVSCHRYYDASRRRETGARTIPGGLRKSQS